jgi:hypothetical protein
VIDVSLVAIAMPSKKRRSDPHEHDLLFRHEIDEALRPSTNRLPVTETYIDVVPRGRLIVGEHFARDNRSHHFVDTAWHVGLVEH